LLLLGKDW